MRQRGREVYRLYDEQAFLSGTLDPDRDAGVLDEEDQASGGAAPRSAHEHGLAAVASLLIVVGAAVVLAAGEGALPFGARRVGVSGRRAARMPGAGARRVSSRASNARGGIASATRQQQPPHTRAAPRLSRPRPLDARAATQQRSASRHAGTDGELAAAESATAPAPRALATNADSAEPATRSEFGFER